MPADHPHRSGAASTDARRPAANPWRVELRELGRRLSAYVADADPLSLAGVAARTPAAPGTAP